MKRRNAGSVQQIALAGGSAKHPQATAIVGADYYGKAVDKWDYPAGGTPVKSVNVGAAPFVS
jgi:hypothetical protein